MQAIMVQPGDVYSAHVGGNGDAETVAATIAVHSPSGRIVADWTGEDEVILGESVSALRDRGYTVTLWASEAGS